MRKFSLAFFAIVFALTLSLSSNARAADICDIQEALQQHGYYDGGIDCDYGPLTYYAIRAFQRDHDLYIDGVVGPNTARRLFGRHYDD